MRVEINRQEVIFHRFFFRIEEAHLRHERYDGSMSDDLVRLNFERGDSAAVVLHDPQTDLVIFTEQFRYPTHAKGPGWLLEIPAGTVDDDDEDDPIRTMRREVMEEIGYRVDKLKYICKFYVTPGGSSERIHLYYAAISPKDREGAGGGLLHEGEDIRILGIPAIRAFDMVERGELVDAKSIIGIQWLLLNHTRLLPSA